MQNNHSSSPSQPPTFKINLCSRAGKSTNNLYLAFQDPLKNADVQSKVQKYMGTASQPKVKTESTMPRLNQDPQVLALLGQNFQKKQKESQLEGGVTAAQKQQSPEEAQLALKRQMQEIEHENRYHMLSDTQRIRKEMKFVDKNVTETEITEAVFKERKRNFTSHFQTCTRTQRAEQQVDKCQFPSVGQYHYNLELVQEAMPQPVSNYELQNKTHLNRVKAQRLIQRNIKKKTIMCTHIIKALQKDHGLNAKSKEKEGSKEEKKSDYLMSESDQPSAEKPSTKQRTRNNASRTQQPTPSRKGGMMKTRCGHAHHEPVKLSRKISQQHNDSTSRSIINTYQSIMSINSKASRSKLNNSGLDFSPSPRISKPNLFEMKRNSMDNFGYKTCFQTPSHHIATQKSSIVSGTFQIIPNHYDSFNQSSNIQTYQFDKQTKRMPFGSKYTVNPKRFNNINKDPACLSRTKHTMGFSFEKQSPRDLYKTFLKPNPFCPDYEKGAHQKEVITNKKLSTGGGFSRSNQNNRLGQVRKSMPQSIDMSLSRMNQDWQLTGPNTNFRQMLPRDEAMYRQTQLMDNIWLENTKENRIIEAEKKKEERLEMQLQTPKRYVNTRRYRKV